MYLIPIDWIFSKVLFWGVLLFPWLLAIAAWLHQLFRKVSGGDGLGWILPHPKRIPLLFSIYSGRVAAAACFGPFRSWVALVAVWFWDGCLNSDPELKATIPTASSPFFGAAELERSSWVLATASSLQTDAYWGFASKTTNWDFRYVQMHKPGYSLFN